MCTMAHHQHTVTTETHINTMLQRAPVRTHATLKQTEGGHKTRSDLEARLRVALFIVPAHAPKGEGQPQRVLLEAGCSGAGTSTSCSTGSRSTCRAARSSRRSRSRRAHSSALGVEGQGERSTSRQRRCQACLPQPPPTFVCVCVCVCVCVFGAGMNACGRQLASRCAAWQGFITEACRCAERQGGQEGRNLARQHCVCDTRIKRAQKTGSSADMGDG